MPDGVTAAQLTWAETFTGLDIPAGGTPAGKSKTVPASAITAPRDGVPLPDGSSAGQPLFSGPWMPGSSLPEFHGDGAGSKAPLPPPADGPDEIKRKAYAKINAGGTLEPSDYAGLDSADVVELLKAETAIKQREVKELTDAIEERQRLPDMVNRIAALIRDESVVEVAAVKQANTLCDRVVELAKSAKYHELTSVFPAFESALKAAEELRAQRPKFLQQAQQTSERVAKLTDAQLEHLPAQDAAQLLHDLLLAGKPKDALFAAQVRLYKHTKLDKAFVDADAEHERQIVASVQGDRELETARKDWNHADPEAKIKALQKLADKQCHVYGIPNIAVVRMPHDQEEPKNGVVVEGGYWPDGKIHLNFGESAKTRDFKDMMTTIFHEVAHHYQSQLVEKYNSGELKPSDPLYGQAALFAANALLGANINDRDVDAHPGHADEILDAYRAQPNERHAFKTSAAMAGAAMRVL